MNTILQIPIPQAVLDEKRALLATHGFHFPGNTGSGSFNGIKFDYHYDGTHLTLTVTKKSAFIPMALVKMKIQEWTGVEVQEKES